MSVAPPPPMYWDVVKLDGNESPEKFWDEERKKFKMDHFSQLVTLRAQEGHVLSLLSLKICLSE